MITGWMLYGLAISALLGIAACSAEVALLRWRMPTRAVWSGALLGTLLIPLASALSGPERRVLGGATEVSVGEAMVLGDAAGAVEPRAWLRSPVVAQGWDETLGTLWLLASFGVLGFFLVSHAAVRRHRKEWQETEIEGVRAWRSRETGPAVVGFLPGEIVVPMWVEQLPAAQRALLIRHEVGHVRARDPLLLLLGLVTVVAAPWNFVAWWQLRRLRSAIEVDCDRRVIRAEGSVAAYGALLLEVARRASAVPLAASVIGTDGGQLGRRVRIMTGATGRSRWVVLLGSAAICGAVLLTACQVEKPTGPAPRTDTETPVLAEGVDLAAEPTFTPMDVRPRLINREEFGQALDARYPASLKTAGIGGTVITWVFLDDAGDVRQTRVARSSGYPDLDAVAEALLLEIARFTPASNRGVPVPVWIQLPVTFRSDEGAVPPGSLRGDSPDDGSLTRNRRSESADVGRATDDRAGPTEVAASAEPGSSPMRQSTPPPADAPGQRPSGPVFTPMEERPYLENLAEVGQLIEARYPPALRAEGIGGTVMVWLFIDESGEVGTARIATSSGYPALDRAAIEILAEARFIPARNRDRAVGVWVQLPLTFAPSE